MNKLYSVLYVINNKPGLAIIGDEVTTPLGSTGGVVSVYKY